MNSNQPFSVDRYNLLAKKTGAEIITIGYSTNKKPIEVLKKGSGKLKILFISRIHGNEPATTEALLEFFHEYNSNETELYGIYLSNPDGASLYEKLWLKSPEPDWKNNFNDARLNANKIDINRDWLNLSQIETQTLQKFILSLRPHFAADFHEFYWSDKGFPPKLPTDDEDGFLATMTDAPFFYADKYVKGISEQIMNFLTPKLENDFDWKIKPRHFIGQPKNEYTSPTFLGIYLALRGIPKLLVETWGVACSTLFLDKRISFHKKSMNYILDWIQENKSKFILSPHISKSLEFEIDPSNSQQIDSFTKSLDLHKVSYKLEQNKIIVTCNSVEIGFVNTIHYLIYKREPIKNEKL